METINLTDQPTEITLGDSTEMIIQNTSDSGVFWGLQGTGNSWFILGRGETMRVDFSMWMKRKAGIECKIVVGKMGAA